MRLDKNNLIPTQRGLTLIAYLNAVYPALTSPVLTGQWEHQLRLMEQGALSREVFMASLRESVLAMVLDIKAAPPAWLNDGGATSAGPVLGPCPICKADVVEKKMLYSCACGFALWKTIAGKTLPVKNIRQIIKDGETDLIPGFKSKAGKTFDAKLTVDPQKKGVSFAFS